MWGKHSSDPEGIRLPNALQQQFKWAVIGGAIALLLITLLFRWQKYLIRYRRQLRQEFHELQEKLTQQETIDAIDGNISTDIAEQQQKNLFNLKRRIEHKTWQKRILQTLLVVVVVVGIAWILQSFPDTRSLGVIVIRQPLILLLIALTIV